MPGIEQIGMWSRKSWEQCQNLSSGLFLLSEMGISFFSKMPPLGSLITSSTCLKSFFFVSCIVPDFSAFPFSFASSLCWYSLFLTSLSISCIGHVSITLQTQVSSVRKECILESFHLSVCSLGRLAICFASLRPLRKPLLIHLFMAFAGFKQNPAAFSSLVCLQGLRLRMMLIHEKITYIISHIAPW